MRRKRSTHLAFDNVNDRPLADIWNHGEAFNAYRGDDWMQEPCRSCERKKLDFGGLSLSSDGHCG